jgi:hypothetical protein
MHTEAVAGVMVQTFGTRSLNSHFSDEFATSAMVDHAVSVTRQLATILYEGLGLDWNIHDFAHLQGRDKVALSRNLFVARVIQDYPAIACWIYQHLVVRFRLSPEEVFEFATDQEGLFRCKLKAVLYAMVAYKSLPPKLLQLAHFPMLLLVEPTTSLWRAPKHRRAGATPQFLVPSRHGRTPRTRNGVERPRTPVRRTRDRTLSRCADQGR